MKKRQKNHKLRKCPAAYIWRLGRLVFLPLALLVSCKTIEPIPPGAQASYDAINPSRVIAVPVFFLPHPAKVTKIDTPIAISENAEQLLERGVLGAFKDQPNVNGVSFSAVRNAIGSKPNAWTNANKALSDTAQKLISTNEGKRLSLPPDCLARKSFLDFYARCMAKQVAWREVLNEFSRKILNADAAMISVVTELFKEDRPSGTTFHLGFTVLVVDTNNGELIWGREANETLQSNKENPNPELSLFLEGILNEEFWAGFPGRRRKLSDQQSAP